MHALNFQIKNTLFYTWFLLSPLALLGQVHIPVNWNVFKHVTSDHWQMTLHLSPDVYLNSSLKFDAGFKVNISELNSTTIGATFLKNSPKRTFVYGFGTNFNHYLSEFQAFNSLYRIEHQSIGGTIFIGYQKPAIIKNRHPFINVGLTQRYLMNSELSIFDNTLSNYSKSKEINRFPNYGYLELGIRKDEFLIMNDGSELKNLSISVDFPFFNRSDLLSPDRNNFSQQTLKLIHTKNNQLGIRLNYQQYIYKVPSNHLDDNGKDSVKTKNPYLAPLVSIEDPSKHLFGRIFVDFTFSTPRDSVNVSSTKLDTLLIPNAIFNQIAIGYNIHFGNYKGQTFDANEAQDVHFGGFANIAISKNTISSSKNKLYKYESLSLITGAGGRIGYKSFFFLLGFSYKNFLTLKVIRAKTEILRKNPIKESDHLYYSLNIGF
jgi:hypothetical protein